MSNPFEDFDDDFIDQDNEISDFTPQLTSQIDLARLGVNNVAYVRSSIVDGVKGFTIHAADGTPMAMAADRALALAAVVQYDLYPVSVH